MDKDNLEDERCIYTSGKVIAVKGNQLMVEPQVQSGCAGCSAQSGCGTSALAKLFGPRRRQPLQLENTVNAGLNDIVLLSLKKSDLIKHSMMAYGLPLASLMGLSALALVLTGLDWLSAVAGFVGLLIGWYWVKRFYNPMCPKLDKVLTE